MEIATIYNKIKNKKAKYDREYCQKNKERIKERNKKKYIENRVEILAKQKQYRKDNHERILARGKQYGRKWRAENPEYVREYQKEWQKENRKHINEMCRQRRIDRPEYERKYSKRWRKTEKGKASNQRRHITRRARERGIVSTLTSKEWLDILEEYHYRCAYCGCEFDIENMPERDHVIPISKGGDNTKENIVPSCRNCNAKKSNKIILVRGGTI